MFTPDAWAEASEGKGSWVSRDGSWGPISIESALAPDGVYDLPISAGLRVTVLSSSDGQEVLGADLSYGFLDEGLFHEIVGEGDEAIRETFLPMGTTPYFLKAYSNRVGEIEWTPVQEDSLGGGYLEVLARPGLLALKVMHPLYGVEWQLISLAPGQWSIEEVLVDRRPRLFGQVVDMDGNPLAETSVSVLANLDNEDFDLGLGGDAAYTTIVAGQRGNYSRVIRGEVWTDSEGQYSIVLPKAKKFALEASSAEWYGFSETPMLQSNWQIDINLDLTVDRVPFDYQVEIDLENFESKEEFYLRVKIADDVPWFRQFPPVRVQDGKAAFPGLMPGMRKVRFVLCREKNGPALVRYPLLTLPQSPARLHSSMPGD